MLYTFTVNNKQAYEMKKTWQVKLKPIHALKHTQGKINNATS